MSRQISVFLLLAALLAGRSAHASGIDSSATVIGKPDGSAFDYSITLNNSASSSASIGSLWFAWVPGADFLPTNPSNLIAPTGWTATVTNEGPNDGFAIQYVASSPGFDVAPGKSLTGLGFTNTDSPATLAGNSASLPNFPITTSFVYQGAPLVGTSDQFVASVSLAPQTPPSSPDSVPEPSTFLIAGAFSVRTLATKRIRRNKI